MDGLRNVKAARVCFEVEKIIGVSGDGNVRNYQVQWAPVWVSSFHLIGCEHLIQEFLQKQSGGETVTVAHPYQHFESNSITLEVSDAQPSGITSVLQNNKPGADNSHEEESGSSRSFDNETLEQLEEDLQDKSQKIQDNEILSQACVVIKVEDDEIGHDELNTLSSGTDISTVYVLPSYEQSDYANKSSLNTSSNANKVLDAADSNYQQDSITNTIQSTLPCDLVDSSTSSQFSIPPDSITEPQLVVNHKEAKRHSCPVCKKQFNHRNNLNIHHRTHTGVKSYQCSVCGKSFSDGSNMKRHMRIHSGVRPYTCSVCGKACSQKVHLQNHMRTHSAYWYNCAVCGDSFPTSSRLKTHMLVHKGAE